jgi:protein-S-isoprenylcysteine O-methyltransferase Ste14
MADFFLKAGGLALTVACWLWASKGQHSGACDVALVWGAPLLAFPITLWGRRVLDARPEPARVVRLTIPVHYAMMTVLGCGIFSAVRLLGQWPDIRIPLPRLAGLALFVVTGLVTLATVLNLAVRGFGAPMAAKLSSRLAVDWMYAWTRNPMLLATLAWSLSFGLWHQSLWFVVWMLAIVSPGLLYFVRRYEERELHIRFGASYDGYRARTPFLWPRRPRAATAAGE